jgi:sterol 24-C-methyltransferase
MHRMQTPALSNVARDALGDEVARTVEEYRRLHDETRGGDVGARRERYAELARSYYDLVTDFYEYGWGQSFHFATRAVGESFETSIARHELYLAHRLGLRAGVRVLDVGCGVGGPMRTIARFSGAHITGLNNNAYQLKRAALHNREQHLEHLLSYVSCDFMKVPLPDASFDAAYQIEATCHSADLPACYREIARLVKPGGLFAGYEWCLTSRFDPSSQEHRRIKKGIEEGNALPDINTSNQVLAALAGAGLQVIEATDLAPTSDPEMPWYSPLEGGYRSLTGFRRSPIGRWTTHTFVRVLETLRLAPKGATEISTVLNIAADSLVAGGQAGIFTPMFFYLARKR